MTDSDDWIDDKQTAAELGWKPSTLRTRRSLGKPVPKYARWGNVVRSTRRWVEEFKERHIVEPGARREVKKLFPERRGRPRKVPAQAEA